MVHLQHSVYFIYSKEITSNTCLFFTAAVRKTAVGRHNCTEDQIAAPIRRWFTNAGDRDRGRRERMERAKKRQTLNETLRIRKLEHLIMIMRLLAHFALDYKVASSKTSYILKNLRESCILKGSTIPLE